MATLNFDATQHKPQASFDPLPAGKYLVMITDSEEKDTANGKGKFLKLEMTILDGEHKGRKVWDQIMLQHPSVQAMDIARSTLSAVCHAVGVLRPAQSQELHNLPLVVSVSLKKRSDTGELGNEVKGYAPRGDGSAAPQQPAPQQNSTPPQQTQQQQAPQQPAADPSVAPWAR
ncbi:MAG: DUF669 domain-containing protein [Phycisphaeraceae bacterium]|nr:MAG: DUF669 domain-containing protein [Phycisphaeraceae bacterium]